MNYEKLDKDVLFCYLNITMINIATMKFKEYIIYEKISEATTIFKEAFAILVLENNFN